MKLSNVAIDRPVFTTMGAAAVLVMGALALFRLGVDLFPDVAFPVVAITTVYPGAAPEEIEQQVTRPIEEGVSTINGVDVIRSFSRDSVSVVIVLFKLDVDLLRATTDVREKVQSVKLSLPDAADDPQVSKFDPSATPIMIYTVRSDRNATETRRIVDDVIRPTLETVPGVGSVVIGGGTRREIHVDLDQTRLQGLGLSVNTVAQALRAEGFDLPGGRITQGGRELSVKAQGRFRSLEEIERTVLFSMPNGAQIRVADVGDVRDGVEEVRELARVNGKEAVTFNVQKVSGGNTVAVSAAVQAALARLKPTLAKDVEVTLIADQAHFINNNIARLRSHLILGGLLAIMVIFLFMLDVRSTLISAVALPASVIATFFVMWQLGFTLNIMSMLALTLSIGLLIDDSVVVRENIFRHLEMGADPVTAARKGTSEIALAVFATTMTIVAVFVPIGFMGGLIGKFFKEFGLTVAAAVLVSLIVSFTLDPMLSARVAQKVDPDRHEKMRVHWFYGPPTRFFEGLDHAYRGLLSWALRHKITVLGAAAAIFFSSLSLPAFMGTEFFTRGDQGKFEALFELQPGTAIAETDRVALQAEELLQGIPECPTLFTRVGLDRDVSRFAVQALCSGKSERKRHIDDIMAEARTRLAKLPGVSVEIRVPDLANNGQPAPVTLLISGPDFAELQRISERALALVKDTRGTVDVGTSLRPGSPEQRFTVDRVRAADRGVSFIGAAQALRTAVEGEVVSTLPDRGKDIDIRVRLRPEDRTTVAQLMRILVPTRHGGLVRMDEVVRIEEASTPAVIERSNRQRAVTITANLSGRSLGEVLNDITPKLEKIVPAGYTYKFEGEAENMKDTFTNMLIALALAVLFIYFVLASQFESFVHPFTIMLALPLAIIGALLALFLTGLPLGMPAMIGIVLLMGLVTKNGILLVDYTNQLRDRGLGVEEALLKAGPTRLRPILMTSAAIVLGELPTALSTAEGSEFNVPMAVAVIGGVITSTMLTLLVVPVAYTWIDKLAIKRKAVPPLSTPAE
jgi:hydrophobic/amphiphilic exporter-1 (mainly G- bacteria), HAE1 family